MGGGTPRAHTSHAPPRKSPTPPTLRHSRAPLPSFLRPLSVIPAQAGTTPRPIPASPPLFPNSSLPPGRGEVRWGVGRREPPPPALHAPITHPTPLSIFPAPSPSFLRRQEPPLPPNHATLTPEQECRTMPPSPQHRRPAPHPSFLRRQEPNANADQNLTEVDARLTKVDKGCQKLTPSTPTPTPNPSKTQQNRNRAHHPDTPSVNPRCQSLRHTPNNPEQIRTNLNKPEHRQAPRPDREHPRITPQHPEKNKPRTPPPPTRPRGSCLRRNDGTGGRRA